jgi:hypothetical protein
VPLDGILTLFERKICPLKEKISEKKYSFLFTEPLGGGQGSGY